MPDLSYRPLLFGLSAALTLVGLAALPGTAAGSPQPSVPPQLMEAMQRDFALSPEEVRSRVSEESAAAKTATRIRAQLGDRVSGLWFDAASGKLNAAVADPADAPEARAAGAIVHSAAHTRAELAEALRHVSESAGAGVAAVQSWGPDVRNNRIEVTVTRSGRTAATDAFLAEVGTLGPIVHINHSDQTPRQQADVVGGEKWTPGSESPCSIGFPVTRSGGGKAFLTAGHCTNDVNQAAYGKDGSRLGTSNRNGTGSVNAREGDMGIVDVDQPNWNLAPTVSGYGAGDITVTGSADALVGSAICRSGQTTSLRCGEVTKVDQSVDYGSVVIEGLSYSNACSAGGDSGGAYVTATGGKAVGLHSGGGSATCTSGSGEKYTIFQPVNEAITRFGAVLVTSTPQPGGVTVSAVSTQTTLVGTAAEVSNSAEGGTAPYTWKATGLPAGLSITPATGTIAGTPTTTGTSNVTVTATDSAGKTGSTSFSWNVTGSQGGTLTLTSPGSQTAYIGRPVTLPLRATGGSAPYSFKATNLPGGLAIDPATGTVSGAPTSWGFRSSTVTVTDSTGRSGSAGITWNVYF
ncbi:MULTISPECIES: putative Ig domain-containing protein [unclassified Streptomyces]|uniref:putative Ig domain-containing protein n=1 Tax=unclassified Streptomyces TaxID=2593676 RepID=UPI0037A97610